MSAGGYACVGGLRSVDGSVEPLTNTKYENNARAKSTGDRVIELLALGESASAGESKGAARLT